MTHQHDDVYAYKDTEILTCPPSTLKKTRTHVCFIIEWLFSVLTSSKRGEGGMEMEVSKKQVHLSAAAKKGQSWIWHGCSLCIQRWRVHTAIEERTGAVQDQHKNRHKHDVGRRESLKKWHKSEHRRYARQEPLKTTACQLFQSPRQVSQSYLTIINQTAGSSVATHTHNPQLQLQAAAK